MPLLLSEGHSERLSGGHGGKATAQLSWEIEERLSFLLFLLFLHLSISFSFLVGRNELPHSQGGWPGGEFSSEERAEIQHDREAWSLALLLLGVQSLASLVFCCFLPHSAFFWLPCACWVAEEEGRWGRHQKCSFPMPK